MALTASDRDAAAQRLKMVNGQLRVRDVNDLDLLAAFLDTPREVFVAPEKARFAYLDSDQPSLARRRAGCCRRPCWRDCSRRRR